MYLVEFLEFLSFFFILCYKVMDLFVMEWMFFCIFFLIFEEVLWRIFYISLGRVEFISFISVFNGKLFEIIVGCC